jgi:hypothetical protein
MHEQIRRAPGVLYVVTALVTGLLASYLIGGASIGGPWSWWYVVTLGASVLLLVGGVHTVFPRIKHKWLVAIAGTVSLAPWNLGAWLGEGLAFALVVALVCWGVLVVAPLRKRGWILPLAASVLLAAWWIPASVQTLRTFFSPKPPSLDPMQLAWTLVPSVLAIASLIASATSSRKSVAGG